MVFVQLRIFVSYSDIAFNYEASFYHEQNILALKRIIYF